MFALNNSALVKPTENRHKICLLLQVGLGDVEAFIIMIVMGNLMQMVRKYEDMRYELKTSYLLRLITLTYMEMSNMLSDYN